jgi:peptidoglycan/xylan/chitin deacetylase (PgdA/CDA1 family)
LHYLKDSNRFFGWILLREKSKAIDWNHITDPLSTKKHIDGSKNGTSNFKESKIKFDMVIKIIRMLLVICLGISETICAQQTKYANKVFIHSLYQDSLYMAKKKKVEKLFDHVSPGHWGEFVKGVDEDLVTNRKIIALTFDACGNRSNKFNRSLIDYLRAEHIPATLFVTGTWIDDNYLAFLDLCKDTLFEIENHGYNHQPCSVDGESKYGIKGTPDVPDAFDEMEANERKIEAISGRRPLFYRSATAFTDEACARIARILNITIVSFDILSGDAMPLAPPDRIAGNVVKAARPGAIVIMHFNHPEWYGTDALKLMVPALRRQGYTFARLKDYPLREK